MIDLVKFGDGFKISAADLVANPLGSLKVGGILAFSHNPFLIGCHSVQILFGSTTGNYGCKAKKRKYRPDCINEKSVDLTNIFSLFCLSGGYSEKMLLYNKSTLNRGPFRYLKTCA